jgi:nicotinate-nucleotide pyrophosphorylase (carboxylating)
MIITKTIDALISAALREDMPHGDITSESLISRKSLSRALLVAKAPGVLAGIDVARRVFLRLDPDTSFDILVRDGERFQPGEVLAEIEGLSVVMLEAERTALNFVQRMSGIATTTRAYMDAIAGTKAKILDTRKTTPGLRELEKYAVRMGGGENHRPNLSDMVLIKDNHLMIVGDIGLAVARARKKVGRKILVEVEVTSFAQARTAVAAGADWVMLDNMTQAAMKRVVDWAKGRVKIEASGNVDLNSVRKIAALGVDYISVGRLTHSYASVDLSLEFLGKPGLAAKGSERSGARRGAKS